MKRPPINRKLRAEAMAKNNGVCMAPSSCIRPGVICEHIIPWAICREHKLDNLEPRCRQHAKKKTKIDVKVIAHVKRMAGETGQYKRREARGGSLLKGRGFPPKPEGYKHKWGSKA